MSQSNIDLLNRALLLPAGDYLEAENGADKKFLLAIANHNNFTEGVAKLQRAFNMTPEECQKLVGNLKFPLTENLLIAAIHLISPLELEELLNGQDTSFDPSLNDDAILKALVHAVHRQKMDHVKVLFNCPYIKPYFLPENYYRFYLYIDYSCKNFGDASFVEFLVKKQPGKTLAFVDMFYSSSGYLQRPDTLFKIYAVAPKLFHSDVACQLFKNSYQFWQVKPEELFVMLQDCNLDILPCISDASWNLFASTSYNNDAVKCVIDTYCPEENLSPSVDPYWKEIATKFNANRKSLDQDLLLENETFLLVFIKYFCDDYSRFEKFVTFLKERSLFSESMENNIFAHFSGLQD